MAAYLETMAIAVAFEETVVSKIHEDSVDVLRLHSSKRLGLMTSN